MLEIIIIDTKTPQETRTLQLFPENQLNQECLIGRDSRCSLVLNDQLTSRSHGKIAFHDGDYFYGDLGSKNGSKINNDDVQVNREYRLKSLDVIALGNHLLWVKAIAQEETALVSGGLTPEQYMPLAMIDTDRLETWTQGSKKVKCVQIIDETIDVKTFTFVCDPPVKFAYQPGQFLTLNLDLNGQRVQRSYSLSSTPSRPHTLEITVKRVPPPDYAPRVAPGLVSNWLHDNLKVGSQIEVNAPQGQFTNFAHPAAKLLLISAGSGLTPMMSMARWICDTQSNVDLVFFYSARSPQDIIFRQELEMMSSRFPNFKLAITVTRSGQSWYGYRGRINPGMLSAIAPDYQDRSIYVCGPESFRELTKELLHKINFPMTNFYEESFGSREQNQQVIPTALAENQILRMQTEAILAESIAAEPITRIVERSSASATSLAVADVAPVAVSSTSSSVIVLSKSGKEVASDGTECILETVEAKGIHLPFGCRMGVCGACKVKKIAGEVIYDHDDSAEDEFIYTCVARPVGRVVIEA